MAFYPPAQARDKAIAILDNVAKGIDPVNKKLNKKLFLKEFINNEYASWVKAHRKVGQKTLDHIRRCFFEPFGNKLLTELTPSLIDQWRTQRLKKGVSVETVNRDVATFKAAISKAVLWSIIDSNPLFAARRTFQFNLE